MGPWGQASPDEGLVVAAGSAATSPVRSDFYSGVWLGLRPQPCSLQLYASLTFRGCELNVILLAEVGWEDGVGGGVVTEPVGAICGGSPVYTDHQVTVQEDLVVAEKETEPGVLNCTPIPG